MLSVLMSVYYKDSPSDLRQALSSLLSQSVLAEEVVIVLDGHVGKELTIELENFKCKARELNVTVKIAPLDENIGLGGALNYGTTLCSSDYIVRMDSDDLCAHDRFQTLVNFIKRNPRVDVIGGQVEEFQNEPGDLSRLRIVPEQHEAIVKFSKWRSPMNHVTVCIKRDVLLNSGGYESVLYKEDYFLWLKLIKYGAIFANLPNVHVHVRVGNGMVGRRHGLKFFKYEYAFTKLAVNRGYFSGIRGIMFLIPRFLTRILPVGILENIYSFLLRRR